MMLGGIGMSWLLCEVGVVMVACMVLVVCLSSVLFWIFPLRGCCNAWRNVIDVLCFLIMLVLGMIVVFVFSE